MNTEVAVDLFKEVITFALMLMGPFLLVVVVVGLIAGLIQAVTSIQEQTLTFVPKVFVLGLMLIFMAPWLARTMIDFATNIIGRLPDFAL